MERIRPVVAVDFDDVIATFNESYIDHHNKHYETPRLTFEEAYTYDMPKLYGVSADVLIKRVRRFCHNHHHEIRPMSGVYDAMTILSAKCKLPIVTSRCESLTNITLDWLDEYRLAHFEEAHFTNGFGSIMPTKRSKLEVCKKINAQVLIEDGPPNAVNVADGGIPVLLFDRPWNREKELDEHPHITRIHSWNEVIEWIATNL
jgi:uncharacterized HAD superfamily protein